MRKVVPTQTAVAAALLSGDDFQLYDLQYRTPDGKVFGFTVVGQAGDMSQGVNQLAVHLNQGSNVVEHINPIPKCELLPQVDGKFLSPEERLSFTLCTFFRDLMLTRRDELGTR